MSEKGNICMYNERPWILCPSGYRLVSQNYLRKGDSLSRHQVACLLWPWPLRECEHPGMTGPFVFVGQGNVQKWHTFIKGAIFPYGFCCSYRKMQDGKVVFLLSQSGRTCGILSEGTLVFPPNNSLYIYFFF